MKYIMIALVIIIVLAACQPGQQKTDTSSTTQSAADSGWVSLFDGSTFKGWHTYGKTTVGSAWNIDSASIHLQPGAKNGYQTQGGGDLTTDSAFSNFDLKLKWKVGKKANSGIMFYVQDNAVKYKETWFTGPEMQVLDIDSNEDAHSPKHMVGDLYDLIAGSSHPGNPWNVWNDVEIKSDHGKLDLFLNGVNIISTTLWDDKWKQLIAGSKFKNMPGFGTFTSGHIALQDHGEEVWYKDIMIKKL